jgi:hypothetical protein
VACVHQVAYIDFWRGRQHLAPSPAGDRQSQGLVQLQ